jgi:molybdenum cofactor cytidylyltransferase
MKFGPASPADAIGGVTVHTLRQGALVLKKGTTIGPAEVEALTKAGVAEIVVVRLEEGDVSEDVAAASIAQAVAGDGVNVERAFTGRANLFAAKAGVLVVDRAAVDRINGVDEAITFATLAAYKPVVEGEMIATVKLIPFGVEAKLRDAAVAVAGHGALKIAPYTIKRVGVVSTLLSGLAPKVVEKTLRVTAERLGGGGGAIAGKRHAHDEAVLASSIKELLGLGAELVIVFGASAIADRRDVIPAAITEIGGAIEHFGMPVDPGNLLLIGSAGGVPVLGAPGCARSPVENGFDWVLMRLLAGLKVTRAELTGMGVGGLLMEIVTRPQPRTVAEIEANRNVAAIVLAAGRSTRMGGPNKLLAELDGKKLVRTVAEQALASKASEVIVVTGHQAELVEQALAGLKVRFVRNPDFAGGLASSVKAGIGAVPDKADGAIVCLGDMPLIDAKLIDHLIETFAPDRGQLIVVPVSDGRRGNPVLWSKRFFRELMTLDGDIGARHLIAKHAEAVAEVAVEGVGAFLDIDTPQALEAARRS